MYRLTVTVHKNLPPIKNLKGFCHRVTDRIQKEGKIRAGEEMFTSSLNISREAAGKGVGVVGGEY
jgi:hypothetical protein